jgi:hypothetical protein
MLLWHPDRQISRRKAAHCIMDEEGTVKFWAYTVAEVLKWLEEQGETSIQIIVDANPERFDLYPTTNTEVLSNG